MTLKKLQYLILLTFAGLWAVICAVTFLPFSHSSFQFGFLFRATMIFLGCGLVFSLFFSLRYFYARMMRDDRRFEDERLRQLEAVADLRLRTIETLVIAIDAKDQTRQGHVRRTQVYAVELGKLLNVSEWEIEALKTAALLHDIGKLAVPDYILNKPDRLTPAEFEKMKIHSVVGADIVSRINFPYPVEDAVRYHHERWDGRGYPSALKADHIPLVARIISVVDFYDATRCDRPYRPGMTRDESLRLLSRMAGKNFDPSVVEIFVKEVERFDELISRSDLDEQAKSEEAVSPGRESAASGKQTDALIVREAPSGFRSIAEAQREVSALYEMAQTIGSSLSLQDTCALVASKLNIIVPFDTCLIYILDDKSGKAEPVHTTGLHEDYFSKRSVAIGEGITGWVVANARSMSDNSAELDLSSAPLQIASQFQSVLASPLLGEGGSFGAITLYSNVAATYTADHIRLLETVCFHISGALNNALMFEKTKDSALTDTLTGLHNARALQLMLERRVAECRRLDRQPIAVLSIDVNNFKEINDELGHGVGDRLLAAVAQVVNSQLRDMDLLARYSGDEFVAVLPTATAEVAAMVAERVRSAVESHKFQIKTGRAVQIEISFGIACYPVDGDTAGALILAATQNMRRKKSARAFSTDASTSAKILEIDAYR